MNMAARKSTQHLLAQKTHSPFSAKLLHRRVLFLDICYYLVVVFQDQHSREASEPACICSSDSTSISSSHLGLLTLTKGRATHTGYEAIVI